MRDPKQGGSQAPRNGREPVPREVTPQEVLGPPLANLVMQRQPIRELDDPIVKEGQPCLHPQCARGPIVVAQQCREAAAQQLESLLAPDVPKNLLVWLGERL